jgi:glycosyltransferase involved in cell wall biosynthesis
VVVPNGATSDVFDLHKLQESRVAGTPFRFASVLNGWSVRKNGSCLLKSFALLHREFGDQVELSMFGEGHGPDGPAQQWAKSHGLEEGVRFKGLMPYPTLMRTLAADTDAFVHPSLEEAHSMAVTEAMAIGLPVIGGLNSGGIPWALSYGDAGLLVDVTSPASLASGMRKLLTDGKLRSQLAQRGRQKALREYSVQEAAGKYENLLTSAAHDQNHNFDRIGYEATPRSQNSSW